MLSQYGLAMPVMDGRECLERLLHLDPGARVLLTTGHGGQQARLAHPREKQPEVLRKPYDLAQLLNQIRRSLASRGEPR